MMLETQPEIYLDEYKQTHSDALIAFRNEKQDVRTIDLGEVS